MSCLGYQQLAVSTNVLDVASFTIPTGTNSVLIQAETQNLRYTLDGDTPTAGATGSGMLLPTGLHPREIPVQDFRNIKIIRGAGSDGTLNVEYHGGRAV